MVMIESPNEPAERFKYERLKTMHFCQARPVAEPMHTESAKPTSTMHLILSYRCFNRH